MKFRLLRLRRPAQFGPLAAALAVAVLVIAAIWVVAELLEREAAARYRADVVNEVSGTRAELEKSLNARLALVDGIGAFAIANPDFDQADFNAFAEGLVLERQLRGVGADPAIRGLQLAPDAVVTYVHPRQGNEEAIGHDLLADPDRRDAVLSAIVQRRFVLAGPFELLQGGVGLVGRNPLYIPSSDGAGEFWGLAVIVLNFDVLLEEAGLSSPQVGDLSYSMRGRDGTGAAGEVFLGDDGVFAVDPVLFDVTLPNGRWQLAAAPDGGWPSQFGIAGFSLRVGGVAAAILLALMVWWWTRTRLEAARVSEELAQIVDTASAPIIGISRNGVVTEWNRAAEELSGISSQDMLGVHLARSPLADLNSEEDRRRTAHAIANVLEGRNVRDFEVRWNRDAAPVTISFNITSSRDASGAVAGVVAIGQDISARLEGEAIQAENVAMATRAQLKDQFLAGMSHELRTPLNAVIGLSSSLGRETLGPLNQKQTEYVTLIGESGRHLLALINEILDFSKMAAGEEALDLAPVLPAAVSRKALGMVTQLALDEAIELTDRIPDDLPEFVADERRVTQVLINLLSNGIKFTPEGGRVGLEVAASGTTVEFSVWDTGIGIPEAKRHLLFTPFQQVDSTLARSYEGTGLGLAITRQLVTLHDGTISFESEEGAGSRFTAGFPIAGPQLNADPSPAGE